MGGVRGAQPRVGTRGWNADGFSGVIGRHKSPLLACTALTVFAAVGLISPMSVRDAAADCSGPGFPVVAITCTNSDTNGYTSALLGTNVTVTFNPNPGQIGSVSNGGVAMLLTQAPGGSMLFNMNNSASSITSGTGFAALNINTGAAADHTYNINGGIIANQGTGIVGLYGQGGTVNLNLDAASAVRAYDTGVFLTSADKIANITVKNAGQVNGDTGNGIALLGVLGSGSLTVENSGRIGIEDHEIGNSTADSAITILSSTSHTVTGDNKTTGTIHSNGNGILLGSLTGKSSATNDGKITAGGFGISTNSGGDSTATNSATGVINSTGTGISVLSGAVATGTNAGTIKSTAGAGMIVTSLGGAAIGTNSSANSITAFSSGMVVTGATSATADNTGGAISTVNGIGLGAIAGIGPAVVHNEAAGSPAVGGTVVSTNGQGILATAVKGLVDVNSETGKVNSGSDGITALSLAGGNVTVDSGLVTSTGGSGVTGTALDGNASVITHGKVTANGLIGVSAIASGTADVDLRLQTITNNGGAGVNATGGGHTTVLARGSTVVSDAGFGISATSLHGNALVEAGTVDATNGGSGSGSGILANAFGTATVNLHGDPNPDIYPLVGNVKADGLFGVSAIGGTGATVDLDARTVTNDGGIGVNAISLTGDATVNGVGSTIKSFGTSILAGGKNVYVDANDVASQYGSGIRAIGGEVDVDVLGDVKGAGGLLTATVSGIADGAFSLNVASGASLKNSDGTWGDAVNIASGKGIEIVNDGTIEGNMNLFSLSGGNYVQNNSNNSWDWSGLTTFTALGVDEDNVVDNNGTATAGPFSLTTFISTGDSIINNNAGATFNSNGLNGMVFIEGGISQFNNAGTFNVHGWTAFLGLDEFNNSNVTNMADGHVFDKLVTTGDFIGSDNSTLHIDTQLTPGGYADLLVVGGDLKGVTTLEIEDLIGGPGQYISNDDAILFALVGGNTDSSNFTTNGGISKGFFTYDAYLRETPINVFDMNEWVIASSENQRSFELPVLAYGAQQMWHTSTGAWSDRTADLRSAFGGMAFGGGGADAVVDPLEPAMVTGNVTPGIWGRVFGATQGRDLSNTSAPPSGLEGFATTFDNNFDQDTYGVMAGIDFGRESVTDRGGQAWIFGLFGGYTGSNLTFDNSDTDVDYSAGSVGAYVTYLNGGLFVDATLKADFGKMDYSSGGDSGSADYTSIGGVVDTGYRFTMASGFYVEPKATLAYVQTEFDNIEIFGTDVAFNDGDSLRGRLGARVGTSMDRSGTLIEPYVEASVWNEFDGDYSAAFFSNGTGFVPGFDADGVYGEVALGSSFINASNGWSGFARGAVQFGEDSTLGLTGNLGVRKAW